jgi:hypothetical protein
MGHDAYVSTNQLLICGYSLIKRDGRVGTIYLVYFVVLLWVQFLCEAQGPTQ